MKYFSLLIAALFVCVNITSCKDDDIDNPDKPNGTDNGGNGPSEGVNVLTFLANNFVYQVMDYYYLYNEGITDSKGDPVINYSKEPDTKKYFSKLLNEKDIFSFITDDADAFKQEQNGISTDMGWDYSFMYGDSERKTVVASINYVYKGTPADRAGILRGDYVMSVNGKQMTPSNYRDNWGSNGEYEIMRFDENDQKSIFKVNLTSEQINTSPVAEANIFTLTDGTKVGYLLYMNFYSKFNDELTSVFSQFKEAGVSRLILDLRYNPGGEMTACSHLASLIAPRNVVEAKSQIIHYKYNKYLTSEIGNDETNFTNTVLNANLNLSDVVIIQGNGSFSASEATIIGLKPYMKVYTIGSTSGGKNTAMFVMTPGDFVNKTTNEPAFDKRINHWLIAPLVAQYYNSADETFDTSDGDGMAPDFSYNELSDLRRLPLGDASEVLVSLAIEYIANGSIASDKSYSLSQWGNIIPATDYKHINAVQIPFTYQPEIQ